MFYAWPQQQHRHEYKHASELIEKSAGGEYGRRQEGLWIFIYVYLFPGGVGPGVDRVPSFLSNRPNWLPLPPHQQAFGSGGVAHSLEGQEGAGGANSDEGTDTLVL